MSQALCYGPHGPSVPAYKISYKSALRSRSYSHLNKNCQNF